MESRTPTLVFNFLAASGFIMLLATVVSAALSPRIHRSKTWFSMIISWIVYATSYMLILGHQMGPQPPRGICGLQMLLIYASRRTAISGLAFIIDMHLRIKRALFTKDDHEYTRPLLIVPWALFVAVAAEALLVVHNFAEIQRDPNHMYCHSMGDIQAQVSATICVIGLSSALCMESKISPAYTSTLKRALTLDQVWTSVILYRNWALFHRLSTSVSDLRLSSLIRVLVFTLMVSTGLGYGSYLKFKSVADIRPSPSLGVTHPNLTDGLSVWSALLPICRAIYVPLISFKLTRLFPSASLMWNGFWHAERYNTLLDVLEAPGCDFFKFLTQRCRSLKLAWEALPGCGHTSNRERTWTMIVLCYYA
ncbi:hypothetical protein DFH09DRAFT_1128763 [Mycena vulgaris]|nr:hypothetical protein DFH09DRAFT_1128763 [Mycena vulgaris]